MANIVGPGSQVQETAEPGSLLDGASEYEYVTLFNPLSDDFQVMVAQDVPVNLPFEIRDKTAMVQNESDVTKNYGIGLKNPDHRAKKYIHNTTIIPAGGTVTFRGNEAQVALRQLVNEIMQRNKQSRLIADPNLRRTVEEQIIRKRGSVQELMDNNIQTPRAQVDEAIQRSNEVQDEPAFPTVTQETPGADSSRGAEASSPASGDQVSPRRVGRPKKAN